jgi:hypothetical protein
MGNMKSNFFNGRLRAATFYQDLTHRERAGLIFHFSVAGNETARAQVLATFPRHLPADVRNHVFALDELSRAYATHYWRMRAHWYRALHLGDASAARGFQSESLALERALERTAYVHGFLPADMRKLANIEQDSPAMPFDLLADLRTERKLTIAFEGIMQAGGGPIDADIISRTNH